MLSILYFEKAKLMIIMRLGYDIKDFFKRTINDRTNIGYK